ncbi:MAG: alginate lyase family protein [Caldilineaceae bacterium]|nr:alginate lyase family protein [Caldilineaceae bacterium]
MESPRLHAWLQKAELFAAKGLGYHRTYAHWRVRRLASRLKPDTTVSTGLDLAAMLHLEKPELAQVCAAHLQKDEKAVNLALNAYFRTRQTPRFLFDVSQIDEIVALVNRHDEANKTQTIQTADQICQGIFSFRKADPVVFAGPVEWQHCPNGNTDWTWDLNRHAYFESLGRAYWYTGDERYVAKFSDLLHDWLAHNPASVRQPSWSSVFEVAFRINAWIGALHLFQHSPSLDEATHTALLAGLWTHGQFLDTYLELHAQNNHLLLESKSLAMLGILFPEFKAAARWRERGLTIFCQELRAQVCADGVHGERASLYHRIISGELLELLVLADQNAIALPPEIAQIFTKMVEFELWLTKPDGQVPLVGDSALEDMHLRYSGVSGGAALMQLHHLKAAAPDLGERELWLLGPQRVAAYLGSAAEPVEVGSRAFAEGGYITMRGESDPASAYALFDCGPFGYALDSTHGHADALNLELYAHGQSWVVDPGVYSTHLGWQWRRFFRGTRGHNTVVVDGQDQSRLLDWRRVYRPAKTSLQAWISNPTFDFVAASHDGYERLAAPITHQRQIFFVKPHYWIVIDQLSGAGEHAFDLYFHLMPGLVVHHDPASGAAHVENEQGARLQVLPVDDTLSSLELITGATEPVQGWVSRYSGEKSPAPVLRYHRQTAAPTCFCTLLYPESAAAAQSSIQATHLAVTTEPTLADQTTLSALRIETDEHLDHLVIAPDSAGIAKRFDGYETDAELLYMRRQKASGALLALEMHKGSQCHPFEPQPDYTNAL